MGKLCDRNFHWLEPEVRRYTLKCEAKQKARGTGAQAAQIMAHMQ